MRLGPGLSYLGGAHQGRAGQHGGLQSGSIPHMQTLEPAGNSLWALPTSATWPQHLHPAASSLMPGHCQGPGCKWKPQTAASSWIGVLGGCTMQVVRAQGAPHKGFSQPGPAPLWGREPGRKPLCCPTLLCHQGCSSRMGNVCAPSPTSLTSLKLLWSLYLQYASCDLITLMIEVRPRIERCLVRMFYSNHANWSTSHFLITKRAVVLAYEYACLSH